MDKWERIFKISILIAVFMTGILIGHARHEKQHSDEISAVSVEINRIKEHQKELESVVDLAEEYQAIILQLQKDNRKLQETLERFDIDIFEATAYTHVKTYGVADINGTGFGITASGKKVREGFVAVDPDVIPLGSKVWVDGHGWQEAADTGGAIKGNRIDIFMDDRNAAVEFGRKQKVIVYELR